MFLPISEFAVICLSGLALVASSPQSSSPFLHVPTTNHVVNSDEDILKWFIQQTYSHIPKGK